MDPWNSYKSETPTGAFWLRLNGISFLRISGISFSQDAAERSNAHDLGPAAGPFRVDSPSRTSRLAHERAGSIVRAGPDTSEDRDGRSHPQMHFHILPRGASLVFDIYAHTFDICRNEFCYFLTRFCRSLVTRPQMDRRINCFKQQPFSSSHPLAAAALKICTTHTKSASARGAL